jgi:hypothetical protein
VDKETVMQRVMLVGAVAAVLGGCAASKSSVDKDSGGAAAMFGALKGLEGTWVSRGEDGQERVALVTRVIANGSVVHETMFPGSEHEMVNTYHCDGARLVVTHYCAGGNQPRMECRDASGGVFRFTFRDITNHAGAGENYMGELTVTLKDKDHLEQAWASFQDGKRTAGPVFQLRRRKG